jgi:hypothetical protein
MDEANLVRLASLTATALDALAHVHLPEYRAKVADPGNDPPADRLSPEDCHRLVTTLPLRIMALRIMALRCPRRASRGRRPPPPAG